MEIVISEVLKNLRKNKGISQEVIAETMGISVQAVSKWENNLSYPDIELLPRISEYYNVSIDYLLTGKTSKNVDEESSKDTIPNDDILRIVQYKGNRILSKNTYDKNKRIMLEIKESNISQVEIWGSADIKGDIDGNVNAGEGINCGNVGGNVTVGEGANCGNVGGDVTATEGVNCGNVGGDVRVEDEINCGNIGGNVTAGDDVNCGDIKGTVAAGDEINCGNIIGNVIVGDSINCANIEGNIQQCEGDIHCVHINGEVHCEGDIYYKDR